MPMPVANSSSRNCDAPSGRIDIEIHAKEILTLREQLNSILSGHTGQPLDKIQADSDRNFFMSAEEAMEYGIIDYVMTSHTERVRQERGEKGADD